MKKLLLLLVAVMLYSSTYASIDVASKFMIVKGKPVLNKKYVAPVVIINKIPVPITKAVIVNVVATWQEIKKPQYGVVIAPKKPERTQEQKEADDYNKRCSDGRCIWIWMPRTIIITPPVEDITKSYTCWRTFLWGTPFNPKMWAFKDIKCTKREYEIQKQLYPWDFK